MNLSDLFGDAGLAVFSEAGLILSLIAFLAVAISIFRGRRREAHERARLLPMDDGAPASAKETEDD